MMLLVTGEKTSRVSVYKGGKAGRSGGICKRDKTDKISGHVFCTFFFFIIFKVY